MGFEPYQYLNTSRKDNRASWPSRSESEIFDGLSI